MSVRLFPFQPVGNREWQWKRCLVMWSPVDFEPDVVYKHSYTGNVSGATKSIKSDVICITIIS
jgi:hypothetical protein